MTQEISNKKQIIKHFADECNNFLDFLDQHTYDFTKKFVRKKDNIRQQQIQEIVGETTKSKAEKNLDELFLVASTNMGIISLSLFFPILIAFAIPGLLYSTVPIYQLAYKSIKEKKVSSYIIDAIFVTGILLGGFIKTGVLGCFIFASSRKLLSSSEKKSKANLTNLFANQPKSVFILVDNVEVEIPCEKLERGDIVVAVAGQAICVDGIVKKGLASVDQHALTGESQPIKKEPGDNVFASTIILSGKLYIEIQKKGKETVATQIAETLNHTAEFTSSIQSRGEAIADKMVIPTVGASAIIFPFLGANGSLAILTNTFGYKMRLFAPASVLSFLNVASQQGILVKDGRCFDLLNDVDIVIFDKTGTLTLEQPTVVKIHSCNGASKNEILSYAAIAESKQTHPIAKAIMAAAQKQKLSLPEYEDSQYEIGYGIEVTLPNQVIRVGSENFMVMKGIHVLDKMLHLQKTCHEQGYVLVFIASDDELLGAIELHTTIREGAKEVIENLKQREKEIYIISGDHEAPTKKLADDLGIDNYFASVLPKDKANIVSELQEKGKSVCFVGDGINDAIALKKANVSISLRGATTIATDTAQIILMDGDLKRLDQLFEMMEYFEKNMKNNLWISTVPSTVCIGGVILFSWGVFTGMLITGGTLFLGIGNALLPLKKYNSNKKRKAV